MDFEAETGTIYRKEVCVQYCQVEEVVAPVPDGCLDRYYIYRKEIFSISSYYEDRVPVPASKFCRHWYWIRKELLYEGK
jgi:hypothetical protein